MRPVCPRCQSADVYEMTDAISNDYIDALLSPEVLVSLGISLCQSFKVPPSIGVIAGSVLASIAEVTKSNRLLPMPGNKAYRCGDCTHVFTAFN